MSKRIAVLVIVPTAYVFGLQNAVLSFFKHLDRGGFFPVFLVSRWNDGSLITRLRGLDMTHELSYLGFLSKKLKWTAMRMTLVCLLHWPRLVLDLWRLMRRYRFDLIYVTENFLLVQILLMLILWRKPVVCHVHDPAPATAFHKLLQWVLDYGVTRYVAISDSVKDRLVALGVPPSKITRIYNGIDVLRFDSKESTKDVFRRLFGWPKRVTLVGMTGQMMEKKGHLDFIEAASLLHDGRRDLKFVIIGKRDGDYYSQLERRVSELRLDETVVFCDWQEDVADVMTSIDVLVMPSRHEEGFGLVVAEAMAAGKPVVITRSGGAAELVADGEEGFIVEKADPAGLARAIMKILEDPRMAARMGEAGRKRVEDMFCIQKQADLLGGVILEVVNRSFASTCGSEKAKPQADASRL